MSVQCLRRCSNIIPTLGQRLVFAEVVKATACYEKFELSVFQFQRNEMFLPSSLISIQYCEKPSRLRGIVLDQRPPSCEVLILYLESSVIRLSYNSPSSEYLSWYSTICMCTEWYAASFIPSLTRNVPPTWLGRIRWGWFRYQIMFIYVLYGQ